MQITLPPAARISTNVRIWPVRVPLGATAKTLARGAALRASAMVAPLLAGAWAERLFLTPPRPQFPAAEVYDLMDARAGFVAHLGRQLATWRWGSIDAPAVLLAHGWGGRALQLRAFVHPLLAAGFRVIAFDQPAHGSSEGNLTGLPDFAGALAAVARHYGGVTAVLAHSLGATAGALANAQHLALERIVLISPPSDLVGYSRRFARWHWLPERVRVAMQAAIEERYGLRWAELELERLAPRLAAAALVIHDTEDRMVPFEQGERFAHAWRGAQLLQTRGLGHRRILEDRTVVDTAVAFLRGGSGRAARAERALPNPAPLY